MTTLNFPNQTRNNEDTATNM